ncbi:MAG: hypothetical protein R2932_21540 [Caldilineaceae bacterium]
MMRELLTTQLIGAVMDGVLVLTFLLSLALASPGFGLVTLGIGLIQILLLLAFRSGCTIWRNAICPHQAATQSYIWWKRWPASIW